MSTLTAPPGQQRLLVQGSKIQPERERLREKEFQMHNELCSLEASGAPERNGLLKAASCSGKGQGNEVHYLV